jgi:hypothetical protein
MTLTVGVDNVMKSEILEGGSHYCLWSRHITESVFKYMHYVHKHIHSLTHLSGDDCITLDIACYKM